MHKTTNGLKLEAELLGLTTSTAKISNMSIETITVPDKVIQSVLKHIRLNQDAQDEVMDKLVDRTPGYFELHPEEQVAKVTTALTIETVIEFLRLTEYIREDVSMLENGISDESAIVITAYYIRDHEVTNKVFADEMTEEQVNQMEREINLFNSEVDIYEEAKKRLAKMNNVIPFQNREERRRAKKRGQRV